MADRPMSPDEMADFEEHVVHHSELTRDVNLPASEAPIDVIPEKDRPDVPDTAPGLRSPD